MGKKLKALLAIGSILLLVLAGCGESMKISAAEIVEQALETEENVKAYYGEITMKIYDNDELIEESKGVEYIAADGKRKTIMHDKINDQEIEALNDGKKVIMYEKTAGEAYEMPADEELMALGSPKDQFKSFLELMKDSHDYQLLGEEKIQDFKTHHIQMKPKKEGSLFGDVELWVDQKTWFIIKVVMHTGDEKMESEYTTLDFSPDFTDDVFTIDIPKDVNITPFDELDTSEAVTKEEAEEVLGQPFLMFDGLTYDSLEVAEVLDRNEVMMDVIDKDGTPILGLSVFPTPEGMEPNQTHEVRGQKAEYDEQISSILWDEDGLRYVVISYQPEYDAEKIIELAKDMKLSSELK